MNFAISAARPYQTHDILQAALLTGQMGKKKERKKKVPLAFLQGKL